MTKKVKWTHKGWFGLAPVYLSNLHKDMPDLSSRYALLEWWLDFNEMLAVAILKAGMGTHFPIHGIREMDKPKWM